MSNRAWPFPASRALANWSRQLDRRQPRSLWIAHLLLHRVEALVTACQPAPLSPFDRFILKAVQLAAPATLPELEARLGLDRQALFQVLRGLQCRQLADSTAAGWDVTGLGRQAAATGQYPRQFQERRSFTFVHHDDPDRSPHYLCLSGESATPWTADAGWTFDPAALETACGQPSDWKDRHGFPCDVVGLVRGDQPDQVVIDRPEKLTVALVRTADRLIGLPVLDDWTLRVDAPLFELPDDAETFPELAELSEAAWRQAWEEWCQSRKVAISGPVTLQADGLTLRASSSEQPLREQFGKRADVLKGEAWLLAGSGRFRRAVLLEVA